MAINTERATSPYSYVPVSATFSEASTGISLTAIGKRSNLHEKRSARKTDTDEECSIRPVLPRTRVYTQPKPGRMENNGRFRPLRIATLRPVTG
jgi:hypothetical protein